MIKIFKNFKNDENGAVSVDWVVLTAGMVGLAITAIATIESQTVNHAADIAATIEDADVTGIVAAAGTVGG